MKTVDVPLLGRVYQVACAPGQEKRLAQLAAMVEEKMRRAAGAGQGAVGEIRLLLLAGLMLADDVLEARTAAEHAIEEERRRLVLEEDVVVGAIEHLAGRINGLASKLDAA